MRIAFFTPDLDSNSLGRTYCLWLLARELGWDARVYSTRGTHVWAPLTSDPFAKTCTLIDASPTRAAPEPFLRDCDLVIAVKPLPTSLGVAHAWARELGKPMVADVDDPDVESKTVWERPVRRLGRLLLQGGRQRDLRRMGRLARTLPSMVSSPVLGDIYGGVVIPHARHHEPFAGHRDGSGPLTVAFVGTPHAHKGIDLLRSAVDELSGEGFELVVTAAPPADARPWERWVGTTSLAEGAALIAGADIVALPSLLTPWSRGQLPAKLIDAMMAGKAVVASDIGPIAWALADTGHLFEPGDRAALVGAMRRLADSRYRTELGARARARAVGTFSVAALAPRFEAVCRYAVDALEAHV
ncbi:glycosyltransferase family 4 protein [Cellulomonas sp. NPDC057328]|uniref:glycosyltransferase family 4 protein n=1 Tax=Cellulomonas sp. NPDC057328 TaxID=3346101 RepID=UPI00362B50F2